MQEVIQFTPDEVESITGFQTNKNTIYIQLGQLKVEKEKRINEFNSLESQLLQQHMELTAKETEFIADLNVKYGDGNYDIVTNQFTPIKTSATDN